MSVSSNSPEPEHELLPIMDSSSSDDDDMDDPFIATHLQIHGDEGSRRVFVPWTSIGGEAQRPAPAASIDALPTVEVSEPGEVCAICKDDLPVGAAATRLPCGHLYDSSCIVAWLEVHNSCPVCRSRLPSISSPVVPSSEQDPPPTVVSSDQLRAPAATTEEGEEIVVLSIRV
ncbi:unnamed protein product [Urochloa humidicola]